MEGGYTRLSGGLFFVLLCITSVFAVPVYETVSSSHPKLRFRTGRFAQRVAKLKKGFLY